jgi:hypothetical protein
MSAFGVHDISHSKNADYAHFIVVIGIGCYPKNRPGSKWVARRSPGAEKRTSKLANALVRPFAPRRSPGHDRPGRPSLSDSREQGLPPPTPP